MENSLKSYRNRIKAIKYRNKVCLIRLTALERKDIIENRANPYHDERGRFAHAPAGSSHIIKDDKKTTGSEDSRLDIKDIVDNPALLGKYNPTSLKLVLSNSGYDIKPLSSGSLKGKPFEQGGGYKVNFEDGGLVQYHPNSHSHHKGAYYKISTGKMGVKRYELDGTEKKD